MTEREKLEVAQWLASKGDGYWHAVAFLEEWCGLDFMAAQDKALRLQNETIRTNT